MDEKKEEEMCLIHELRKNEAIKDNTRRERERLWKKSKGNKDGKKPHANEKQNKSVSGILQEV